MDNNKPKMIAAKETFYDDDYDLWRTYIGLNDTNMTLICSVWGKTEAESLANAAAILEKLR